MDKLSNFIISSIVCTYVKMFCTSILYRYYLYSLLQKKNKNVCCKCPTFKLPDWNLLWEYCWSDPLHLYPLCNDVDWSLSRCQNYLDFEDRVHHVPPGKLLSVGCEHCLYPCSTVQPPHRFCIGWLRAYEFI